jgi:hypothetical protein
MPGSQGVERLAAQGNWGRALTGGLILALAAGALALAWWKGLSRFLVANIPPDQWFHDGLDFGESMTRDVREFFTFLGLATGTGFILGVLYVMLRRRRDGGATGAARASGVGRAAGAAFVGVILVLAVAAESMVATQLRGNVIGWLRGEPYRKDLRKRLALQELKLELQSASQLPGPGAGMVAGMNVHARIKALARLGRDAVPDLVAMLSDGDPDTRRAAVITLAGMAPVAAEGPRAVTDALRDNQHTDVRWEAADALGTMVPRSRQAVAALVRALEEDKDASVRWKAAEALGKVLNELDRRPDVVEALGGIGPEVEAAVTALANALRNEGDGQARWKAAEALAGIGPAAKSAGPALLEALKEGKVDRGTAGGVLKRIDPEAAKKAGFK